MFSSKPYVEQTDPPRSPRETLPTMYDLPSEEPNEPGLPDEYHYLQPQLLSATFRLSDYAAAEVFNEDLGKTQRGSNQPPTKWEIYERILRVPYYVVFDRYTDQLRAFNLVANRYQELNLTEPRIWMPTLNIGLGLWQGECRGINHQWLRWYDATGNWIPTEAEQLAATQQQAEQLAERLRAMGIDPDEV